MAFQLKLLFIGIAVSMALAQNYGGVQIYELGEPSYSAEQDAAYADGADVGHVSGYGLSQYDDVAATYDGSGYAEETYGSDYSAAYAPKSYAAEDIYPFSALPKPSYSENAYAAFSAPLTSYASDPKYTKSSYKQSSYQAPYSPNSYVKESSYKSDVSVPYGQSSYMRSLQTPYAGAARTSYQQQHSYGNQAANNYQSSHAPKSYASQATPKYSKINYVTSSNYEQTSSYEKPKSYSAPVSSSYDRRLSNYEKPKFYSAPVSSSYDRRPHNYQSSYAARSYEVAKPSYSPAAKQNYAPKNYAKGFGGIACGFGADCDDEEYGYNNASCKLNNLLTYLHYINQTFFNTLASDCSDNSAYYSQKQLASKIARLPEIPRYNPLDIVRFYEPLKYNAFNSSIRSNNANFESYSNDGAYSGNRRGNNSALNSGDDRVANIGTGSGDDRTYNIGFGSGYYRSNNFGTNSGDGFVYNIGNQTGNDRENYNGDYRNATAIAIPATVEDVWSGFLRIWK